MTQETTQNAMQEIRGTLLLNFIPTINQSPRVIITGYSDWYIQPYPDFKGRMIDEVPNNEVVLPEPIRLEKGDLLTVFNEVITADVLLLKRLNLAPQGACSNQEISMTRRQWHSLFDWGLPANAIIKASSENRTPKRNISGRLFIDIPQGESGTMCLIENGKGYIDHHALKSGDVLTVLTNVSDGKTLFAKALDFKDKTPDFHPDVLFSPYPRIPLNIENPGMFLEAFLNRAPAVVRRAPRPSFS